MPSLLITTMQFHPLLSSTTILTHWQPNDKWCAIEELVACLVEDEQISVNQKTEVIDVVFEREHKMSTGL